VKNDLFVVMFVLYSEDLVSVTYAVASEDLEDAGIAADLPLVVTLDVDLGFVDRSVTSVLDLEF
jgi:hypothetical protein